ncbi:MAG: amino acid racemase [Oscillospiraceae bacterium]|nr:amino acid racemase [Oscillospiraceae bacterium]
MKTLGIIGGLGPAASAYFYELITRLTKADCDQQHIEIVLFSRSDTPDRSAFITGESDDSPLPSILEVAAVLNSVGADYIAIPCITAHYFIDEIRKTSKVPIISMVEETVKHLRIKSVKSVGILATDGTIASGLFQSALKNAGIAPVLPESQTEVMNIINAVKAGKAVDCAALLRIAQSCGTDTVLLGCTELSLPGKSIVDSNITDCMEILARRAITLCGGETRV